MLEPASWRGIELSKLIKEDPGHLAWQPPRNNHDVYGISNYFRFKLGSIQQHEFRVSKGVQNIPGSFQSNVPSGKSLLYFGLLLASGVFFIFIAFTMFLPVMMLMPQKFAICFTIGCAFIIGSFFALKGPRNQLAHMSSKERLPFTLGFIGSMVGTIYVSMVLHSYVLSALFSVVQVLALSYYALSYFPGGSAGMKFLSSTLTSSILRCFGSFT